MLTPLLVGKRGCDQNQYEDRRNRFQCRHEQVAE